MANTLAQMQLILRDTLTEVENQTVYLDFSFIDHSDEFGYRNQKVLIDRPQYMQYREGWSMGTFSDIKEKQAELQFGDPIGVDLTFSGAEMSFYFENQKTDKVRTFRERVILPAAKAIAEGIERKIRDEYYRAWWCLGTVGTPMGSFLDAAEIASRLDDTAVPNGGMRYLVTAPMTGYRLQNAILTNQIQSKNANAFERDRVGLVAGFDTFRTQNFISHVCGARAATGGAVNGANQGTTYDLAGGPNEQTLNVDGFANSLAGAFKKGDVFTLAGVFAVNPIPGKVGTTKPVLPYLQQFTVLEDADTNGSGQAALKISPAIITSGPFQTVSAAPADNAPITFVGASGATVQQSLAFHKYAFVSASRKMPELASVEQVSETYKGVSMTLARSGSLTDYVNQVRLDTMFATKMIAPYLAARRVD